MRQAHRAMFAFLWQIKWIAISLWFAVVMLLAVDAPAFVLFVIAGLAWVWMMRRALR